MIKVVSLETTGWHLEVRKWKATEEEIEPRR